jgi:F-type H+-transporting ATPase subunit b
MVAETSATHVTGETHAGTQAHGGGEHGPTLLGLSAEGWVYVGVSIFFIIAFVFAKAHKTLLAGLDARIADAQKMLDEAATVRGEAEALLTKAKAQSDASAGDAQAIIANAATEAAGMITKAEADTKDLVARRSQMAEDRIGAAERSAVAELRAKAANLSAVTAAQLIAGGHSAAADRALVDNAIAGLGRLN